MSAAAATDRVLEGVCTMPDLLMEFCRQAGEQLADPKTYPALPPGSLPDQAAREKLFTDVEGPITQAFYISPNQICAVPAVILLVRADASLNALAETSLPGLTMNAALVRFCHLDYS
jgi:hypothetical protein